MDQGKGYNTMSDCNVVSAAELVVVVVVVVAIEVMTAPGSCQSLHCDSCPADTGALVGDDGENVGAALNDALYAADVVRAGPQKTDGCAQGSYWAM